jgi:DNA-binding NarL/FixJ family response regulator
MSSQRQNSAESVMEALRILIADDHPAVRILLRNILETVPRWKVCGEAENGSSAVALAAGLHQTSLSWTW